MIPLLKLILVRRTGRHIFLEQISSLLPPGFFLAALLALLFVVRGLFLHVFVVHCFALVADAAHGHHPRLADFLPVENLFPLLVAALDAVLHQRLVVGDRGGKVVFLAAAAAVIVSVVIVELLNGVLGRLGCILFQGLGGHVPHAVGGLLCLLSLFSAQEVLLLLFFDNVVQSDGNLADGLVEHGQDLVGRKAQFLRQRIDHLVLDPDAAQNGGLNAGQLESLSEPSQKVQPGHRRQEIRDQVVIAQISSVQLEPLHVVGGHRVAEFLGRDLSGGDSGALLHVLGLAQLVQNRDRGPDLHVSEGAGQHRDESSLRIVDKGVEPRVVHSRGLWECPDHDRRVLAGQFVLRLPQIKHLHARPAPEFVQAESQSKRGSDPVETGRINFGEWEKEWRQLFPGSEFLCQDSLSALSAVLVTVGVRGVAFVFALFVVVVGIVERYHVSVVEPVKQFHGARPIPHALDRRMNRDSNNACTTQLGEFRISELLGNGPGNQISGGSMPASELRFHGLARDFSLQCYLHHRQDIG
mmetsp:Transcript_9751/g.29051  ORF Transcript_9751/g.29051 Transcript_9751/m.29051 type:complete len:525 (+) Transcript_9751:110-1684(+)